MLTSENTMIFDLLKEKVCNSVVYYFFFVNMLHFT